MTDQDRPRVDVARGVRSSLRHNASAYPFSVFVTATFGIVDTVIGGRDVGRIFLFVLGATIAFALAEMAASKGFRDRVRPERSEVVMLGASLAVVSVSAACGAAVACAHLIGGTAGWFVAPFAGTVTYIAISAVEMAFARRREHAMDDA